MKIIKVKYYKEQVEVLSKKYKNIHKDLFKFESLLDLEPFSDLGYGIYKYRIGNTSIPVGKRGGFRIIVKKYNNIVLPILIYSKTIKENITDKEIVTGLETVLNQFKQQNNKN